MAVLPNSTGGAVRVLLLDDDPANLMLRAAILRQHGYSCITASAVEEALQTLDVIDIAVLDYHLGAGQFGTEVATVLRERRPQVPIIILSATLEHRFGGVEDMHLLKGHSSVDDLVAALRSLDAKRRGAPVVVNASDFLYSRISLAVGPKTLMQIFDMQGNWVYCNDDAAEYLDHPKHWFAGRNAFDELPEFIPVWREVIYSVAKTRETYIDRSRRGLLEPPRQGDQNATWSVLAFPITLHNGGPGVVLTARVLDRPAPFPFNGALS
jgi:CheY-like chemotaxis protein